MGAPTLQNFSLDHWLKRGAQMKASDVHLHTGYPPLFRLNGVLTPMCDEVLAGTDVARAVGGILSDSEKTSFRELKDVDFTYEIKGAARYRVSAFITQSGLNASFRIVNAEPNTLEELGLPSALVRFTEYHHGLVLITGPAGCGKSTTLAALVNMINEKRPGDHILCLEDPIEIIHKNKGCVVNQRQIPHHSTSYARAMRAALREDPDIIIIGEMRDAETISLALTAAETGHLVMATMHTTDAVKSITRIIDSFPPEKQSQIRTMLSESLQGVFSQLLLPTPDGSSRVMCHEILFVNPAIASMIREKKTFQIPQVMQTGRNQGMLTMATCIGDLVRAGKIDKEVAKKYVDESQAFF